jgi:flagellum-specific peptidoglycan hydrolase FlgJ
MMIIDKNLPVVVKRAVNDSMDQFKVLIKKVWFRIAFFLMLVILVTQKEFSIQFTIGGNGEDIPEQQAALLPTSSSPRAIATSHVDQKASLVSSADSQKKWWNVIRERSSDIRSKMNLANSATAVGAALTPEQQKQAARYSNLGFVMSPNFAKKHNVPAAIVAMKMKIVHDYIDTYAKTAKEEAELFGIPVSITLAQGLLESNAGKSSLAAKENNHFGIKCRKKCIGCRCANYTDDSRYDMFRIFGSAWESFREHSKLLSGRRYKHLTNLPRTDYKNWANGLQAAGYATDKKYGKKLIKLIEALDLDRFDK